MKDFELIKEGVAPGEPFDRSVSRDGESAEEQFVDVVQAATVARDAKSATDLAMALEQAEMIINALPEGRRGEARATIEVLRKSKDSLLQP